ncbi:hypothetical protein [Aquincola sp. J276]|uniref:hypothetical protein n=1 Tax=Aquincola sp. J276 TaxID=2898432 RepID=UPI002150CE8A|nr:hypothetical protein [Aquincola sp. J276]MCR5869278.1 hypothetical protein [Aquincola sp. J276]
MDSTTHLAAGQVGFLLAARHARVGHAQRHRRAAGVIPVRVAGHAGPVHRLEAAAEVVLHPEVQVGVVAVAGVEQRGLEAALVVGGQHRHLVAAQPPPPVRPQAQPRQQQLGMVGERAAHHLGRAAAQAGLQRGRQLDAVLRRQRLRIERLRHAAAEQRARVEGLGTGDRLRHRRAAQHLQQVVAQLEDVPLGQPADPPWQPVHLAHMHPGAADGAMVRQALDAAAQPAEAERPVVDDEAGNVDHGLQPLADEQHRLVGAEAF